ncbi:MAG: hypothetical protein OHK0029_25650 [Armatimonadaceae bacterium]
MSKEHAQRALSELKGAVQQFVKNNLGTTSAKVTHALGLESDFQGSQKNYLAWSILGILVNENQIRTEKQGRSRLFYPVEGNN